MELPLELVQECLVHQAATQLLVLELPKTLLAHTTVML